jgi:hypothetical protein
MSDNPAPEPPTSPTHFASGYFRDQTAAGALPELGRGMVGHVPIVAISLITLGVIEGGFALFCALFALVALALPRDAVGNAEVIALMYGAIAVTCAITGIFRIVSGLFNLSFRRRKLGIAALAVGLIAAFTGLCAPTAIAVAVYGLIVYFNDSAIAAFEMGDRGKTRGEIEAAFPPGK